MKCSLFTCDLWGQCYMFKRKIYFIVYVMSEKNVFKNGFDQLINLIHRFYSLSK